jgi:hypothetical protein
MHDMACPHRRGGVRADERGARAENVEADPRRWHDGVQGCALTVASWLTAYALELGHQLPGRARVDGYDKGEAWVPPEEQQHGGSFLDAEELAGRGLAVFPIVRGSKRPATEHGFNDATRDPYQLERWWGEGRPYNIGLATGTRSSVVVVDLDGVLGIDSFKRYVVAGLPLTWCALTVGGVHLYFSHPGGAPLPNTAGKLGHGIDTRGDGGYVVAPPSIHACGVAYRWLRAPWEQDEPAALPRKVLEAWRPARPSTPPRFEPVRSFAPGEDGDRYALEALDRWSRDLALAAKGTRDDLLTRLTYAAGVRVFEGKLSRTAAERALLGAVASWGPLSSRDEAKVRNGISAGMGGKR